MTFHVGQKVVCVATGGASMLHLDAIYTVIAIHAGFGCLGLEIAEASPKEDDDWWIAFRAERFRPIDERETDISIFTRMLTSPKIQEPAAYRIKKQPV